jgi:hypothetical protein
MTNFDIEISKVFVSSPFKIRRVSDAGMGKNKSFYIYTSFPEYV